VIVTDPPYGIGCDGHKPDYSQRKHGARKAFDFAGWDKEIPLNIPDCLRAAKDQVIQLQERFREELRTEREKLQAKDSQLLLTLLSNQPKYQANEKKYNQIPAAVDGLDRSQLRREFTDY